MIAIIMIHGYNTCKRFIVTSILSYVSEAFPEYLYKRCFVVGCLLYVTVFPEKGVISFNNTFEAVKGRKGRIELHNYTMSQSSSLTAFKHMAISGAAEREGLGGGGGGGKL